MNIKPSLQNSLDWFMALLALLSGLAVLQTFIIGKHYIIPTVLLVLTVIFGNLAWFGLHQQKWAKLINFWGGFLLTAHCFFALFWSVKYRALLGANFEWVVGLITILLFLATWFYRKANKFLVKAN